MNDDLSMALDLIGEAKGAEGPNGGFVTDHLDAAEMWLDKVNAALEAQEARIKALEEVLRKAAAQMWDDAVAIEGEWGLGRSGKELEDAGEMPEAYKLSALTLSKAPSIK